MPYREPPDRIKGLPPHAQEIWLAAFNAAWEQYQGDEAKANAVAWAAVKKQYEQDANGEWCRKKESAKVIGYDLSTFVSLDSRGDVWSDVPGWGGTQADITPPEWIRVLPLGKVVLNDGRQPFTVTEDSIKKIIDKFEGNGVDMVIDYEHQTMSGEKAPAAGWIKELRARDDGLWAYVQWTDIAKEYIRNKEYRYYSPTVRLDPQRTVQELLHVGLTNFPAISRIPPLTFKYNNSNSGGKSIVIEKLTSVLGLDENATEVDVIMAVRDLLDSKQICEENVAKLQEATSRIEKLSAELTAAELRAVQAENNLNKQVVPITVVEALGVKRGASLAEIISRIDGLKMAAERAVELDQELANLKGGLVKSTAEQMIEEALKTGRTSPAELEKADGKLKRLAETDPEFFKEFVLGRQPGSVVPLDKLPLGEKEKHGNDSILPDSVRKILTTAGLSVEEFKAQQERERQGKVFVGFGSRV